MLSIAQEDIVGVTLGPDFLTESNVDRSVQISHEELGCFYNIVESTKVHHLSPCCPGISLRMVGILLFRSGRRLNVRSLTCPFADISGSEGQMSKSFMNTIFAVV
jgi:hypothetical protein